MGLPWGLALASGINTYVPLFVVALLARYSHLVNLSPHFRWLASDQAIIILGALAACEILAQKFPGLDNVWDLVHTLLRPLAGALAAGATVSTDMASGLFLTMLVGATLATASHSAKSGLRLVSTTKSLGLANPLLSLAEDAAVVVGTILSVYAPWIMLGLVVLFALFAALVGPWLVRTLWFNLRIVAAWFRWLARRILRVTHPQDLRESLLELSPARLASLRAELAPGEDLQGALRGWRRSGWGPRRSWLLLTSHRAAVVERRLLRKSKVHSLPYSELVLVRHRNLGLFWKLELLMRTGPGITLHLPKTQWVFAAPALHAIRERSPLTSLPTDTAPAKGSTLPRLVRGV